MNLKILRLESGDFDPAGFLRGKIIDLVILFYLVCFRGADIVKVQPVIGFSGGIVMEKNFIEVSEGPHLDIQPGFLLYFAFESFFDALASMYTPSGQVQLS